MRTHPAFRFLCYSYITMELLRYVVLEKKVGETPLSCAEAWRATTSPSYHTIPLSYAGRLDPMASGKLLVLIGDECKRQEEYHALDKRYEFSVLFGIESDTADVLGRLSNHTSKVLPEISEKTLSTVAKSLAGNISLPYPHFSAKTVQGKPLHVWALEGRLNEITIPVQTSTIYSLQLTRIEHKTRVGIYTEALAKVNSIPPVTDARKALGNDFRRTDVRADWESFKNIGNPHDQFPIAHFTCICSSGTYMRSLTEEIGRRL